MDKNENIKNAREELKQVSGDYELRRIAELKEKYRRDEAAALEFVLEKGQKEGFDKGYNSGMQKGIQDGMKQGIEQGIEQGKYKANMQIAKNMLERNMDVKVISEITGLNEKEILELK